jgi:hypothetical protein
MQLESRDAIITMWLIPHLGSSWKQKDPGRAYASFDDVVEDCCLDSEYKYLLVVIVFICLFFGVKNYYFRRQLKLNFFYFWWVFLPLKIIFLFLVAFLCHKNKVIFGSNKNAIDNRFIFGGGRWK